MNLERLATSAVLAVVVLSSNGFLWSNNSHASPEVANDNEGRYCGSSQFELKELLVRDTKDRVLNSTQSGSQVVMYASVKSNCHFDDYPVLVLFEVRDEEGLSQYLAYQNFTINSQEARTVGYSWISEDAGNFNFHVFVHACLNCSGDFGVIRSIDFSVTDGSSASS